MRFSIRTSLLGVIAAALPLSVACGGDSIETIDADDWVADVCDAALDFEDDLANAGEGLDVLEDGDPDEIKDAIDEFTDEANETIDKFVKEIEGVGQPDIDGGRDVIDAIRDHADDEKGAIDDFRDDVNDLDDEDEDDFRDDVIDLLDDTEEFDLRDRLEDINENDVDDLIDDIDADSACSSALFSS